LLGLLAVVVLGVVGALVYSAVSWVRRNPGAVARAAKELREARDDFRAEAKALRETNVAINSSLILAHMTDNDPEKASSIDKAAARVAARVTAAQRAD